MHNPFVHEVARAQGDRIHTLDLLFNYNVVPDQPAARPNAAEGDRVLDKHVVPVKLVRHPLALAHDAPCLPQIADVLRRVGR